ncbi:helix-turn-helix transcriptional regulator [Streptomyces sp. NPDC059491]|uniref:helix-turn-helix transcriptional regulator n=1 Tax=Streptomyces sp. NPDC059491 TaxID=3346850 RepID=UPI0036B927B9
MSMNRPLLTQREAAAACGVSRSTIRRRREAGDLADCVQDDERGWLIPVESLLAAGFRVNAPSPPEDAAPAASSSETTAGVGPDDVAALRAELERERLSHALKVAEARHAAALALAEAGHLRTQLGFVGEIRRRWPQERRQSPGPRFRAGPGAPV